MADRGGGGGGERNRPPLKLDQLCFLFQFFFIRMLKNKAQIARETILGPLSGPWTPAESEIVSALVMCALARNLLRPPPPLNENPGSAPEKRPIGEIGI